MYLQPRLGLAKCCAVPRERLPDESSRLIDSCITQLKAQGPSRTCNDSKEEEGYPVRVVGRRVSRSDTRTASRAASTPCHPISIRQGVERDWYFIAEQPAPAPHLAHPEGCAALRIVLVTVPRVSRGA